ncbi:MAG: IS1380 family transposase [Verrucomicrobia bacterium]|nr:IS1380 family transposase [Verrucomicrobiota bacterium]
MEFPGFRGRKIQADFGGGQVSSDGGLLLLRQVDRRLGLTQRLAELLPEPRDPDRITHSLQSLLQQRLYGLALGYADLNDHDALRHDPLWQTAAERDEALGSSSTLCRWENRAGRKEAWLMHQVLFEQFVASFAAPPQALTLDFDPTDDRVHGKQVGAFYHGYYGDYCFLPLYVFCGEQLLVSYLRPSNCDGARHAWAVLALLVKALRKHWPGVRIRLRADSGLCRWKMLRWCERHQVEYVVGLAKNARLNALSAELQAQAEAQHQASQQKVRLFGAFEYQAGSWDRPRRVIVKAEHTSKGANPRYVVTNLAQEPQPLYEEDYCARGETENRIKEQQLDLFSDRTSCHAWWPNQFRLLLASFAYVLVETLRRVGLAGTELARAQAGTIRLKLLKIGGVVVRNTRRVRLWLSSAFPWQALFRHCVACFDG